MFALLVLPARQPLHTVNVHWFSYFSFCMYSDRSLLGDSQTCSSPISLKSSRVLSGGYVLVPPGAEIIAAMLAFAVPFAFFRPERFEMEVTFMPMLVMR